MGQNNFCTLLDVHGACSVYAYRPLICRLWGTVKRMQCPHGCEPERWLSDEEAHEMIQEVERIENPAMRLNLACGKNKIPGFYNVDISEEVKPDCITNLLKIPWKFKGMVTCADPAAFEIKILEDCSIEEIFCSHFLEHLGDELIPFMDECYRVLKPGGLFRIRCPYYTSIRAWQDPTHKRPISEFLFYYFNAKQREQLGVAHYPIKSDFDIEEMRYHYPEEMKDMGEDERGWLRVHAWNTVADIEVLLRKHDPEKVPKGLIQ